MNFLVLEVTISAVGFVYLPIIFDSVKTDGKEKVKVGFVPILS